MKTKLFLALGVLVTLGTALLFFSGCAQPPTEKVAAVQSNLKDCEDKGAQLFASDEYGKVAAKANELQGLMDQKKYKKADALADTLLTDITALKAAVEANGKNMAQQLAADVDAELAKFKAVLISEESKLLDNESKTTYTTMIGTFEKEVGSLQTTLGNADFVGVHHAAGAIKGRITAAEQEIAQKIEQVKALAAEKAAKAKKGPAKKPAATKKK